MRYAIVRAIHSPTAGDIRTARLVIADVPDKPTVPALADALTSAGRAAEFSEGGVPFGNHEIVAEGLGGGRKGSADLDTAPALTCERLTTPPRSVDGRRIPLRLQPAEFARVSMAAERAGLSLQVWCMRRLLDSPAAKAAAPAAPPAAAEAAK